MAPRFVYRVLALFVSVLPLRIRRELWLFLARLGRKRWRGESTAQRIPGGMYVKGGGRTHPTEGQAMRFIGARTSLPVPVVVDNFTLEGTTWLVMSRLPGYNLADSYLEITPEIEQRLSSQLSRILAPLRAIPPPGPTVCGFDGGPIYCERMAFGSPPLGPFDSVETFHRFLLDRTDGLNVPDGEAARVQDTIKRAHSRPHQIRLTHNDLGPHNVLVDDDWNITGIIDWEACAWMPEYWELAKGTFLPQYRKGRWNRIMTSVFPEYAVELEAERYIVNYRDRYT
ncbi:kinase-like protein [Trametes coccinea BRFM310]|uniref:Kinase-like protein n=1 Tax=Trametes coccinea (strain BRFM310) TaxID=1353009 RepID=A0A1Y2I6D9_TRAC3|nr:kinase-like protein [Trametes coccinea BRFM310]